MKTRVPNEKKARSMHNLSWTIPLILFAVAGTAAAQPVPTGVPEKHIPASVLLELRVLENQFDLALSRDCAPEKCVSKGCVYKDHSVVDLPRNTSLPGLPNQEGIGSVPPQEYLTRAHCEFAHEKSLPIRDIQALQKRLEQRMSKGWLYVTVGRQILEAISPQLAISPPPKPENVPPPPKVEPPAPPPPPEKWEAAIALRELWKTLLPHFAWMIALVMTTLAALFIIWGLRRVGKESIEEKALSAQLLNGGAAQLSAGTSKEEAKQGEIVIAEPETDEAYVAEQQRQWASRIAEADIAKDSGGVVELLRNWLGAREYELLAKAILLFGDRLSLAFSSDGELAVRKVEFADYLRNLDRRQLPSDAEFFKKLNQHAIASTLLAQADAEIYRSLREEFGGAGIAHLVEQLPPRNGALLFALVPPDTQIEVARTLSLQRRIQVAEQLLASNRMSRQDREYLFETLDAARSGLPLGKPPLSAPHEIADRGRELDAAGALSVIMQSIQPEDRKTLFQSALKRFGGTFPSWYSRILYPDMLMGLSTAVRAEVLLDVEIRKLAAWTSIQPLTWQESFITQMNPSLQSALRSNFHFQNKGEQLLLSQQGREQLVVALERMEAQGRVLRAEWMA